MYQRFFIFVLTAATLSGFLLVSFYITEKDFLRKIHIPSWSGLSSSSKHETTTTDSGRERTQNVLLGAPLAATRPSTYGLPVHKPQPNISHPIISGPKAVLVLATTAETDNDWLHYELGDVLTPEYGYSAEIYVTDDQNAPLHTPANKGHEAMAYLTYIIDTYHNLPPVSIFLHGHREAWHNNIMLDMSTSEMIRNLRLDKVEKDGYFNLRCHFNPGCPEHLYPFATEYDSEKSEELLIKDAWMEVFQVSEDQVPRVLAQACCSQFAVTADRIRMLPLEKYVHFRDWLLKSDLTDYLSGRIFEYFWQYMLNGTPVFCPDPRVCYCEGYGVCFEAAGEYDSWFELKGELDKYEDQLQAWYKWQEDKTKEKREAPLELGEPRVELEGNKAKAEEWMKLGAGVSYYRKKKVVATSPLYEPPRDRGAWLIREIDKIRGELERRKQSAMAIGADEAKRERALHDLVGAELPVTESQSR